MENVALVGDVVMELFMRAVMDAGIASAHTHHKLLSWHLDKAELGKSGVAWCAVQFNCRSCVMTHAARRATSALCANVQHRKRTPKI